MSGFLLDTNVLLDIATTDATWLAWSEGQFRAAVAQGPILAEAAGLTMVTRDGARYRTYFPSVALITP